jgi:predicted nucleotidyltransferase/DNA-binding XRE family transcriptional regulator
MSTTMHVTRGTDVAALVRRARHQRNLSQRELAARTGVAQTTIARVEAGHHQPTFETLNKLLNGAGFRAVFDLVNITRPSELLAEHREAILAAGKRHGLTRICVFGSIARGEDGPDSDVDLLVDAGPEVSLFDLAGFAADVEDLLGVDIDVVTPGGLTEPRASVILREARDL